MAAFTPVFSVPPTNALTDIYTAGNTTQVTRVFAYDASGASTVKWAIKRGADTFLQNEYTFSGDTSIELLPSAQTIQSTDIISVQSSNAPNTTFTLNLIENL